MVDRDENVADDRKVKEKAPNRILRLQPQFVVAAHDTQCHKVGEDHASKNDEDVLGNEAPWRVTGAEKCRLM